LKTDFFDIADYEQYAILRGAKMMQKTQKKGIFIVFVGNDAQVGLKKRSLSELYLGYGALRFDHVKIFPQMYIRNF
jgi:hypothetical protein